MNLEYCGFTGHGVAYLERTTNPNMVNFINNYDFLEKSERKDFLEKNLGLVLQTSKKMMGIANSSIYNTAVNFFANVGLDITGKFLVDECFSSSKQLRRDGAKQLFLNNSKPSKKALTDLIWGQNDSETTEFSTEILNKYSELNLI